MMAGFDPRDIADAIQASMERLGITSLDKEELALIVRSLRERRLLPEAQRHWVRSVISTTSPIVVDIELKDLPFQWRFSVYALPLHYELDPDSPGRQLLATLPAEEDAFIGMWDLGSGELSIWLRRNGVSDMYQAIITMMALMVNLTKES